MSKTRIGINGFGRMGRLALRAAWEWPEFEFVHINEVQGDAAAGAHLLTFDSVHGRWDHDARGEGSVLTIDGRSVGYSDDAQPGHVAWDDFGVDLVLECSGKFRTPELLAPYFERDCLRFATPAASSVPRITW